MIRPAVKVKQNKATTGAVDRHVVQLSIKLVKDYLQSVLFASSSISNSQVITVCGHVQAAQEVSCSGRAEATVSEADRHSMFASQTLL